MKKITLKSIEIPVKINSVRNNSNTNIFSYSADNITYKSFTLIDEDFTDISVLITRLNERVVATYPADNMTFSLVSNKVKLTSTVLTTIYIKDTTLAFMCGFDSYTNLLTTNNNSAQLPYLLSMDLYLNFNITNVSSITNNANGLPSSFKISLNSVCNSIFYYGENTSYTQTINIGNCPVLEKISVCITDRWGYSLNSLGMDYSFSLAFEY